MPMSKKADTSKKKRQWKQVEESMKERGANPGAAAKAANAAVAKRRKGRKRS